MCKFVFFDSELSIKQIGLYAKKHYEKIMFGKECDCMKKRMLFVFAIILIVVLCVSAWFYGYYNQKSNDNIPSKESTVSYYNNQGADYVIERLRGYKYTQLREVWGEPNNSLLGL